MPTRQPGEKELVDAIIDGQLDAKALIEKVAAATAAKRIAKAQVLVVRKVLRLRKEGRITVEQGKKLMLDSYRALLLAEFAQHAGAIQDTVDKSHARKMAAVKKLGGKVRGVGPIRDADRLARELERRGVVGEDGELDPNGKADDSKS